MAWKSDSPDYPASNAPYTPATHNPTHCTQCGAKLPAAPKFCSQCGHAVVPLAPRPKNQCLCGLVFGPKDAYCGSCGKAKQ